MGPWPGLVIGRKDMVRSIIEKRKRKSVVRRAVGKREGRGSCYVEVESGPNAFVSPLLLSMPSSITKGRLLAIILYRTDFARIICIHKR